MNLAWTMADFESDENIVLLNPRLPEAEQNRLERLLRGAASLKAHVLVATSGSSGGAKWVALSKQAVLAAARAANEFSGATSKDVWLRSLPPFHVGGLSIYARACLIGGRVIEPKSERWNPHEFVSDCEGVSFASLVPTQVHDLVQLGLRPPTSIRAVLVGGGALGAGLETKAQQLGWPVMPTYGLTEACSQVATDRGSGLEFLPHLEAKTDSEGRIQIRGTSLLTGYLAEEGLIDPKKDGWFTTEDFGEVRDRILTISGRAADRIKIGGELTNLARLREIWESVAGDLMPCSALVAIPDERLESKIVLALEGSAPCETQKDKFNSSVAPFERIREVLNIEKIPRTDLGKIRWAELTALLSQR